MAAEGKDAARYRASPHVIAYWQGSQFLFVNYATRQQLTAAPIVAEVFAALGVWRTVEQLDRILRMRRATAELSGLLSALVQATMVRRFGQPLDPNERAMQHWKSWNPAAGVFHAMTSRVTYLESDLPLAGKSTFSRASRPLVDKSGISVSLQIPPVSCEFSKTLLGRRTWRRFAAERISRENLEALLWFTAGVQGWLHTPRGERLPLMTSPSGGARHPIQLYVLAKHVCDVRSGLYRYDGVSHRLISIGPPVSRIRSYLPRQYWYERAAMVVFFSCRFAATQRRYKYPRAYRAVLLEAGHVCQTFCLTATWLGLAPFCTMALDDQRIETDLGLDGMSQAVLYAAGVGARTRGVPAAPAGQRDIRIVPRRSVGAKNR